MAFRVSEMAFQVRDLLKSEGKMAFRVSEMAF